GRKPTESLDAYDYFLRGMASFHLFTRDSLLEARRLYQRATELDPNYASPYGGASAVATRKPLTLPDKPSLAVLPFQNMSGDPEQESFADGMVEDIIGGLSRIGWLFVIARNSSFTLAAAWSASGWVRIFLGEPANAIERFERAMRLSPLDPLAYIACA